MEDLEYVRDGPALGIDIDGRLQDIAPCLVVSTSKEVTPAGRYTEAEWVDPGNIGWEDRENSKPVSACSPILKWKTVTNCSVKCTVQ